MSGGSATFDQSQMAFNRSSGAIADTGGTATGQGDSPAFAIGAIDGMTSMHALGRRGTDASSASDSSGFAHRYAEGRG